MMVVEKYTVLLGLPLRLLKIIVKGSGVNVDTWANSAVLSMRIFHPVLTTYLCERELNECVYDYID